MKWQITLNGEPHLYPYPTRKAAEAEIELLRSWWLADGHTVRIDYGRTSPHPTAWHFDGWPWPAVYRIERFG